MKKRVDMMMVLMVSYPTSTSAHVAIANMYKLMPNHIVKTNITVIIVKLIP